MVDGSLELPKMLPLATTASRRKTTQPDGHHQKPAEQKRMRRRHTGTLRRNQRLADEASVMAATVSSKIDDGNTKAAIRILTWDDKPAPNSAETLLNLRDEHPRPAAYNHLPSDDKPAPNSAETLLNLRDEHPRPAAYNHLPRTPTYTNLNKSRTLTSFRQSDPFPPVRLAVRMGCAHNTYWSLRRAKKYEQILSHQSQPSLTCFLKESVTTTWPQSSSAARLSP